VVNTEQFTAKGLKSHILEFIDFFKSSEDKNSVYMSRLEGDYKFLTEDGQEAEIEHIQQQFVVLVVRETLVGGILTYKDKVYLCVAKDLRDPDISYLDLRTLILIPDEETNLTEKIEYFCDLMADKERDLQNWIFYNHTSRQEIDPCVFKVGQMFEKFNREGQFVFTSENSVSALSVFNDSVDRMATYNNYLNLKEYPEINGVLGYDLTTYTLVFVVNGRLIMESSSFLKEEGPLVNQLYCMMSNIDLLVTSMCTVQPKESLSLTHQT
jgi:hypothetical protein